MWTRGSDEEIMLEPTKVPGGIVKTMDVEVALEDHS